MVRNLIYAVIATIALNACSGSKISTTNRPVSESKLSEYILRNPNPRKLNSFRGFKEFRDLKKRNSLGSLFESNETSPFLYKGYSVTLRPFKRLPQLGIGIDSWGDEDPYKMMFSLQWTIKR